MMNKQRNGFTLIELLLALALFAGLVALAVPNFTAILSRSKDDAEQLQMQTLLAGFMQQAQIDDSYDLTASGIQDSWTRYMTEITDPDSGMYVEDLQCLIKESDSGKDTYLPLIQEDRLYLICNECQTKSEASIPIKEQGVKIDYLYSAGDESMFNNSTFLVIGDDEYTRIGSPSDDLQERNDPMKDQEMGYEKLFDLEAQGKTYQISTDFIIDQMSALGLQDEGNGPLIGPTIIAERRNGFLLGIFKDLYVTINPQSRGTTYYQVEEPVMKRGWFGWRYYTGEYAWSDEVVYQKGFRLDQKSKRVRAYTIRDGKKSIVTELDLEQGRVAIGQGEQGIEEILGDEKNSNPAWIFDYSEKNGKAYYYAFEIILNQLGSAHGRLVYVHADHVDEVGTYPLPYDDFSSLLTDLHRLLIDVRQDKVSIFIGELNGSEEVKYTEVVASEILSNRDLSQLHRFGFHVGERLSNTSLLNERTNPILAGQKFGLRLLQTPVVVNEESQMIITESPEILRLGTEHLSIQPIDFLLTKSSETDGVFEWRRNLGVWETLDVDESLQEEMVGEDRAGARVSWDKNGRYQARIRNGENTGPIIEVTVHNLIEKLPTPDMKYQQFRILGSWNRLMLYNYTEINQYLMEYPGQVEVVMRDGNNERVIREDQGWIKGSDMPDPSVWEVYLRNVDTSLEEEDRRLSDSSNPEKIAVGDLKEPIIQFSLNDAHDRYLVDMNAERFTKVEYKVTIDGEEQSLKDFNQSITLPLDKDVKVEARAYVGFFFWKYVLTSDWVVEERKANQVEVVPPAPTLVERNSYRVTIHAKNSVDLAYQINDGQWKLEVLPMNRDNLTIQAKKGDTVKAKAKYKASSIWGATTTIVVGQQGEVVVPKPIIEIQTAGKQTRFTLELPGDLNNQQIVQMEYQLSDSEEAANPKQFYSESESCKWTRYESAAVLLDNEKDHYIHARAMNDVGTYSEVATIANPGFQGPQVEGPMISIVENDDITFQLSLSSHGSRIGQYRVLMSENDGEAEWIDYHGLQMVRRDAWGIEAKWKSLNSKTARKKNPFQRELVTPAPSFSTEGCADNEVKILSEYGQLQVKEGNDNYFNRDSGYLTKGLKPGETVQARNYDARLQALGLSGYSEEISMVRVPIALAPPEYTYDGCSNGKVKIIRVDGRRMEYWINTGRKRSITSTMKTLTNLEEGDLVHAITYDSKNNPSEVMELVYADLHKSSIEYKESSKQIIIRVDERNLADLKNGELIVKYRYYWRNNNKKTGWITIDSKLFNQSGEHLIPDQYEGNDISRLKVELIRGSESEKTTWND